MPWVLDYATVSQVIMAATQSALSNFDLITPVLHNPPNYSYYIDAGLIVIAS